MVGNPTRGISLAALALLLPAVVSPAQTPSKSAVIVMQPQDLPEAARLPGESFFLRASGKDGYYLYVEQQGGAQITVFDVTDPAHIKVKSTVRVTASGPYDFVKPVGDKAELVRFRGSDKSAMLDLSKESEPELRDAAEIKAQDATIISEKPVAADVTPNPAVQNVPSAPHDYDVLDENSSPGKPQVVTTIRQVEHKVVNEDTGTTFLLSPAGLTVVRRPDTEQKYTMQKQQVSNQ